MEVVGILVVVHQAFKNCLLRTTPDVQFVDTEGVTTSVLGSDVLEYKAPLVAIRFEGFI